MADDITLNTGTGGDTLGADDISGTKFQRIKLIHGADGTNDGDVSSVNPLPVDITNAKISTTNSTTTPLGSSATFTGTWEDVSGYSSITINGNADVAGTLYWEVSQAGSTADVSVQLSSGNSGVWYVHGLIPTSKYGRVKVVNGASAQTTMNVQTIYTVQPKIVIPTSRATQTINDYTDVINVRQLSDNKLDEASGKQSDRQIVNIFGRNPSVSTAQEDIWYAGGAFTGWIQAADTIRVAAGGDANDTSSGTGARSIKIKGLDSTWALAEETINTNGTSASTASSTSFIRVYEAYVMDVGTYGGANTADIVLETSGGTSVANIEAGKGRTQLGMYTVPLGWTAYCRQLSATVSGSKDADIFFFERENADDITTPFTGARLWQEVASLSGAFHESFQAYPGPFPEKTDIWASAILSTGASAIGVGVDFIMVRN